MTSALIRSVHRLAGALAMLTIACFWLATVAVELGGSMAAVTAVKLWIPWGLLVLIPALAVTGISGLRLGAGQRAAPVAAKRRRMRMIAANGLLILVPAAFFLRWQARVGAFDTAFYVVQAVELAAGAVNLVLLGRNFSAGLALSRRRRLQTT